MKPNKIKGSQRDLFMHEQKRLNRPAVPLFWVKLYHQRALQTVGIKHRAKYVILRVAKNGSSEIRRRKMWSRDRFGDIAPFPSV